jgi:hypothetical protein
MYNKCASVPDSNFNTSAKKAVKDWSIPAKSGPKFKVNVVIISNETAIFRAVRAYAT